MGGLSQCAAKVEQHRVCHAHCAYVRTLMLVLATLTLMAYSLALYLSFRMGANWPARQEI